MQNEFTLRQKRGIGETISDSFSYFKFHFKPIMKAVLILPLPIMMVGAIFIGIFYGQFFETMMQNMDQFDPTPDLGNTIFLFIGGLFLAMGGVVFQATIVEYMKLSLILNKSEIQISDIINGMKKRIGYYIAGSILIYIILVVSMFLLILPFILLLVVFSVYYFTIAIDDKDPGSAIGRSFEIIWGNWWKSFIIYFIMNIIMVLITYALYLPFSLLTIFGGFSSDDPAMLQENLGLFMSIFMPIMVILSSLTSTLLFISIGINYFSLVEEKEEVGLKERIEAVETEV